MPTRIPHSALGLALVMLLALGLTGARAVDTVWQRDAEGKVKSRTGKIKEVSKEKIVLQLTPNPTTVDIDANTIEKVAYEGQPADMGLLPGAVRGGNYNNARDLIRKLSEAGAENGSLKDEIAYYRVYVDARVAMSAGKVQEMKQARDAMVEYLKTGSLSWHYYDIVELLGDMCLAIAAVEVDANRGSWYQFAIDQSYAKLAQAPWEETRIRAAIAKAKAQHLGNNVNAALASYDEAIKLTAGKGAADTHIASLELAAKVGKAEVLGDTKPDEGIKLIQEIVGKADVEDARVQAMSALAIARCYEKGNNPKEALLNYLKVDVMYFTQGNLHAEALYHLSRLWAIPPFNNPQRARDAAETLRTRYPGSIWTGKLGGG